MSLNWKELEAQTADVAQWLKGGVVQKIVQTGLFAAGEAVLIQGFTYEIGPWSLLVSFRGNSVFFGIAPPDLEMDKSKEASAFIMVLRKHFIGSRIAALEQVVGETLLRIRFTGGKQHSLQHIPRRANLFAFDDWRESDRTVRCLGSFRPVSLLPGGRYALPEGKIFEVKSVRDFSEVKGKTLNERIVRHFYQSVVSDGFGAEKNSWLQSIRAARKKIETAMKNAEKDAAKAENAESLRTQAMALSERLFELGPKKVPHVKKMELERMESGEKIMITLDPSRSFSENAEQLFKKAKKMERAQQEMAERSAQLQKKLDDLDGLLDHVEKSEESADLEKISGRMRSAGITPPKLKNEQSKKIKPQEPKDFLEVESSDGFTILCGRNQIENRAVTFKSSKGADIWMHLKGVPGAHVVVKAVKNKTVPLTTLLEAAQVTLYYSKVRNGKKADVDYTYRKNVKAIKGTLAEVSYTDNKTLYVEADSEVIKKLLRELAQ